ncbi:MAG: hypothetical protein GQ542_08140, partial [Desulforhopalus sp.]|nr:hypothetical protein [Desulforhopalus sp.]
MGFQSSTEGRGQDGVKSAFDFGQHTENLPRDIVIFLVRRFCCKTLPSVGKEFGITNYSTVSSVV